SGVVKSLDVDVVCEEHAAVFRRAVQEQVQSLGEVADDRIEGDQEVLDLGGRKTVFGSVFDDRRVEDRLLDRLDGPIQVGNPRGVQRDLDSHRSTQFR